MRDYLPPLRCTTMVPATMSYTLLLCWKKRSVMKTGKRKAMEKFLLSARTVELWTTKKKKQVIFNYFEDSHRYAIQVLEKTREIDCDLGIILWTKLDVEFFMLCVQTHAERETLDAGTTRTRLGRTRVDVSHVTTRRPSRNFPGVAPPAPQIQIVWWTITKHIPFIKCTLIITQWAPCC